MHPAGAGRCEVWRNGGGLRFGAAQLERGRAMRVLRIFVRHQGLDEGEGAAFPCDTSCASPKEGENREFLWDAGVLRVGERGREGLR